MTPEHIRLECLKLVRPVDIRDIDPAWLIAKAKELETFVKGDGHAVEAPSKEPVANAHKARTRQ